jgi:hypothetical protein
MMWFYQSAVKKAKLNAVQQEEILAEEIAVIC